MILGTWHYISSSGVSASPFAVLKMLFPDGSPSKLRPTKKLIKSLNGTQADAHSRPTLVPPHILARSSGVRVRDPIGGGLVGRDHTLWHHARHNEDELILAKNEMIKRDQKS